MNELRIWLRNFVGDSCVRARPTLGLGAKLALNAGEAAMLGAIDEAFERFDRLQMGAVMDHHDNEAAFIGLVAEKAMEDHGKVHGMQGPIRDLLQASLRNLRASGISWIDIFSKLGQIVSIVVGGGGWVQIITAILALFNKQPTPNDLTIPA